MNDPTPAVRTRVARPLLLLLVDDNPRDRDLLVRELRNQFGTIEVSHVRDEAEFARAIDTVSFDAAVIDYQLQWTTGLEVLDRIKATRANCPVIMFTASGSEDVAVEAMKRGLDDYVTKTSKHYGRIPFALAACLERAQQRNELERAVLERQTLTEKIATNEHHLQLALQAARMHAWDDDLSQGRAGILAAEVQHTHTALTAAIDGLGHVNPADIPNLQAAYVASAKSGEAFRCELRLQPLTRPTEMWLEIRGQPLRDQNGRISRMVGISADITERKRAEEALRAAERRKDTFLATLAHELRNPLAPIRYATRLLEPGVPPEMATDARRMIDRQLAHMARLLDDLLDISRVTRGVLVIHREVIDLREAIESAVAAARPIAEAAGVKIAAQLPATPLVVNGDATRLAQVISNLLSNATKYTNEGGHITVAAQIVGQEILIQVQDDGAGISPELLPRIFDLFVQGEATGTRAVGGLGIGLSLARELVELHQGTIEAASAGPGHGSEFRMRLPRSDEKPAVAGRLAAPEKVAVLGAAQLRILVCDDNVDAADALAGVLKLAGYDTTIAYDGQSALTISERIRPDIVLLDVGLPDKSGTEVAREIRNQPWGVNIRLIAVTGWGREDDRNRSREAGFDEHLTKPVDPQDLLQLIARPARSVA